MNKRVLITGETGFLGGIIKNHLAKSCSVVFLPHSAAGRRIDLSSPFSIDIGNAVESVVHVAGLAHSTFRDTKEERRIYEVNYNGTRNLCRAIEESRHLPKNFVFISTVSVYGLIEGFDICENSALNGHSAYARSKIDAERWLSKWAENFNIKLLVLRLPLVAGPNPPGNLGAMIDGIRRGRYFTIGKGDARRSIVLASDVAFIIGKSFGKEGVFNLTDSYHPSFFELANLISSQLHMRTPRSLPIEIVRFLAKVGDRMGVWSPINSYRFSKMVSSLTFNDDHARSMLGWKPHRVIDEFKIF